MDFLESDQPAAGVPPCVPLIDPAYGLQFPRDHIEQIPGDHLNLTPVIFMKLKAVSSCPARRGRQDIADRRQRVQEVSRRHGVHAADSQHQPAPCGHVRSRRRVSVFHQPGRRAKSHRCLCVEAFRHLIARQPGPANLGASIPVDEDDLYFIAGHGMHLIACSPAPWAHGPFLFSTYSPYLAHLMIRGGSAPAGLRPAPPGRGMATARTGARTGRSALDAPRVEHDQCVALRSAGSADAG